MSLEDCISRERDERRRHHERRREAIRRRLLWHAATGVHVEVLHASVTGSPGIGLETTRGHLEELERSGEAQRQDDFWWPTTDRHGEPVTPSTTTPEVPTSKESPMSALPNPEITDAEAVRQLVREHLEEHGPGRTVDIAAAVTGHEPGTSADAMGGDYQRVYGQLNRLYHDDVVTKSRSDDGSVLWAIEGRRPAPRPVTTAATPPAPEVHAILDQVGALFGLDDVEPQAHAERLRRFLQDLGERAGRCLVAAELELDENLEDAEYLRDALDLLERELGQRAALWSEREKAWVEWAERAVGLEGQSYLIDDDELRAQVSMQLKGSLRRPSITADEGKVLRERIAELEEQNKRLSVEGLGLHRLVSDTETQLRSYGIKAFNDLVDGVYKLGQRAKVAETDKDTLLALVEGLLQDCSVPVRPLESRETQVAWARDAFTDVARKVRTLKTHSRDELQRNVTRWLDDIGAAIGEDIESRIQLFGSHARELGKESSHHAKLNQDAHDLLDDAGVPRGGTPAHRIRNLIVKLSDGVLPLTLTNAAGEPIERVTVDSIAGGGWETGGPDWLVVCSEDLTGKLDPTEKRLQYVSEAMLRAAAERSGAVARRDIEGMSGIRLLEALEFAAAHTGPQWPWPTEGATELEVLIGVLSDGGIRCDVVRADDTETDREELIDNCYGGRGNWVSVTIPVPVPERPRIQRLGGAA